MKPNQQALKSIALASLVATASMAPNADAAFVFDIIDADTFTITTNGSTIIEVAEPFFTVSWGTPVGTLFNGVATPSNGANFNGVTTDLYVAGGAISGVNFNAAFSAVSIPDGGVINVDVAGVDLTTLVVPPALPMTSPPNPGVVITGDTTLTPVPEPSSTAILALGASAMLLRRRRP